MFAYKFTAWLKFALSASVAAAVLFFVFLFNTSVFPFAEDKEYYLYSPTSQACIVKKVGLSDLPYIKGECARVETGNSEEYLAKTIEKYAARVVKTEVFDGGKSYYCYSPKINWQTVLDGETVNLHIVVKDGEILLGSPIIFGGY